MQTAGGLDSTVVLNGIIFCFNSRCSRSHNDVSADTFGPLENLIRCGFASLLCGDRLAAAPEPRVSVAKCNHLTGMSLIATNEM